MKRALLVLLALCGVADAQPVITWRPPMNCATSDFLKWNGSAWVCSAGSAITGSGTTNTVAKFTGATSIGDSSINDDGTTVTTASNITITGNSLLTVGGTSPNLSIGPNWGGVDGDSYLATAGANTDIVFGINGAEYLRLDGDDGLSKFAGNTQLGDAAGDVLDVNGDLSKFGSNDGATYIAGSAINSSYSVNGVADLILNNSGFSGGSTQFRNLIVADGKAATVATFTGSDKSFALNGVATLGDAVTDDGHAINGTTTIADGASTVPAASAGTILTLEQANSTSAYLTFRATGAQAGMRFNNSSGAGDGFLVYDGSRRYLWGTAGSVRAELDSNGSHFYGDTTNTAVASNVDVLTLGNTGTGQTGNGKALIVATHSGSFDTTGGVKDNIGINLSITSARSAGSNNLHNYGAILSASGGQLNTALRTDAGDVVLNNSGGETSTGPLTATRVTPATQIYDHTRGTEFFDDLLSEPTDDSDYVVSCGTETLYGGEENNRPGLARVKSNPTGVGPANASCTFVKGSQAGGVGAGWFAGGGAAKGAAAAEILIATPTNGDYHVIMGMFDTVGTQTPSNGIYCLAEDGNANWQVCTAKAGTRTCATTTSTVAVTVDHWYRCEWTVNAGGTTVDFTVTDVTAASSGTAQSTTNIPNTSSNPIGLGATNVRSASTGGGTTPVDYLWFDQTFTTAR